MRVLHVYSGNLYGGIERLLATLADCRAQCPEMEPHFALCFEGRLAGELREAGVPVTLLGSVRTARPWTVLSARRNLTRLLCETDFDAVICHACWPYAVFAPTVRAAGIPLLLWAHDAADGRHWIEKWARRTTPDQIICNSRHTAAATEQLFPGVGQQLIYYPVAAPPIMDGARTRAAVRRELATPDNDVVIVAACRLERWKGHTLLIDALSHLGDLAGWTCWIAGGAQRDVERAYLQELQTAVASHGLKDRVRFLGQRADVPQLFAAADIHCQPNTAAEPFGIAFVEALYAGLPLVTTALGGPLEIVNDDCGILTPPGNAFALATALRKLITDPQARRQLAAAAPARAEQLCGTAAALQRLHEQLAIAADAGEVAV